MVQPRSEVSGNPRHAWGQRRRLAFIDFRLLWEGRVNRRDLTNFFGISTPQASTDLQIYRKALGDEGVQYNATDKCYEPGPKFSPTFVGNAPAGYLHELLALERGFSDRSSTFIGWQPPVGVVESPERTIGARELIAVLHAIRNRRQLKIQYHSLNSGERVWRAISPHALAWNGLRWHVRAFSHEREMFRDFVFGRFLNAKDDGESGIDPEEDTDWHTWVIARIGLDPLLDAGRRAALAKDFGMTNESLEIKIRGALVFYLVHRLGLPEAGWNAQPKVRQLVLQNSEELAPYLPAISEEGDLMD